jgi:hypothetical protein
MTTIIGNSSVGGYTPATALKKPNFQGIQTQGVQFAASAINPDAAASKNICGLGFLTGLITTPFHWLMSLGGNLFGMLRGILPF